jgi:cyclic beta-1,2-glucan synthetase
VLANPHFGALVSERGSMCTWALNSRENQLTPWSNDAVSDPSGENFYLLADDGELWSPAPQPVRRSGARYEVRHGQGYSHFDVGFQGLESRLTVLVAADGGNASRPSRKRTCSTSSRRTRRCSSHGSARWCGSSASSPSTSIRSARPRS